MGALEKAADRVQLLIGNDGSIIDLNTGIDLSISGSNPLNLNTGLKLGDILDLDVDADAASTVLSIGKDGSILDLNTGLDGTQLLIGNDGSILNLDTGHDGTQLSVGGSNLLDIDLGDVDTVTDIEHVLAENTDPRGGQAIQTRRGRF